MNYRSELKKVERLMIKVDKKEKFDGLGFEVLEMKAISEGFFKDAIIDGINSSIDSLMISNGRSSIAIGSIGG